MFSESYHPHISQSPIYVTKCSFRFRRNLPRDNYPNYSQSRKRKKGKHNLASEQLLSQHVRTKTTRHYHHRNHSGARIYLLSSSHPRLVMTNQRKVTTISTVPPSSLLLLRKKVIYLMLASRGEQESFLRIRNASFVFVSDSAIPSTEVGNEESLS